MNTPDSLGQRIRKLRGNIPQKAFALTIGINQNTLSRYEQNKRIPDAEKIEKICEVTGASSDWLLLGVGSMLSKGGYVDKEDLVEKQIELASVCPRCAKLEAKLEKVETQRDSLITEIQKLNNDKMALALENGELRAQLARLEERIDQAGVIEMRGGAA